MEQVDKVEILKLLLPKIVFVLVGFLLLPLFVSFKGIGVKQGM